MGSRCLGAFVDCVGRGCLFVRVSFNVYVGWGGCMPGRMSLKKAHKEYLPVPLDSPIASLLSVQDINFKKGDMAPSTFDAFSDEVLINHNVYTYVLGNILANEAAFGKMPTAPQDMMDAIGIIGDLFRVERWADLLEEKRHLLKKIAG